MPCESDARLDDRLARVLACVLDGARPDAFGWQLVRPQVRVEQRARCGHARRLVWPDHPGSKRLLDRLDRTIGARFGELFEDSAREQSGKEWRCVLTQHLGRLLHCQQVALGHDSRRVIPRLPCGLCCLDRLCREALAAYAEGNEKDEQTNHD
eukprot:scaffold266783_cov35-Tisochrysis_lutea.AAC.1